MRMRWPVNERDQRRTIWLILAGLTVGLALLQVYFNEMRRLDLKRWAETRNATELAEVTLIRRLQETLGKWALDHDGQLPTFEQLPSILNTSKPLPIQPNGDAIYVDPTTGARVRLWLSNMRWMGVLRTSAAQAIPQPSPSAAGEAVTLIRQLIFLAGYAVWGAMFLIYLKRLATDPRDERIRTAGNLLWLSLLTLLLASVGPGYLTPWQTIFESPLPGWVASVVSLLLLALAHKRRSAKDKTPRCANCRYNLTGNMSGICPECGQRVGSASASLF